MSRRTALWVMGGLAGIVVTAAITWATSKLTSEHIGLSSQPLSSMRSLAPRKLPPVRRSKGTRTSTETRTSATSTSTTAAVVTTTATAVVTTATSTTAPQVSSSGTGSSGRGDHEADD